MAILLGLLSALMFGLLDILITQATRTVGTMYTLVLAHATAAGIVLLYLLLFAHTSSITADIPGSFLPLLLCIGGGLGIISGLTNLSLYKALSLGPLALVSPVTASYGLITLALVALVFHEIPSPLLCLMLVLIIGGMLLTTSAGEKGMRAWPRRTLSRTMLFLGGLAFSLALTTTGLLFALLHWLELNSWFILFCCLCEAICMFLACCLAIPPSLLGLHPERTNDQQQRGVIFAIGAMLGFGVEYFLLSLATAYLGPFSPVLISRLCSAFFLFAFTRHQGMRGWGGIQLKGCGLIALIGLFDILGTLFYNIGSRQNAILVAALSSTYPILPFLVGVLRYRERVHRAQWAGVGMMILGMVGLPFFGK